MQDLNAIITRQQAEIERLKTTLDYYEETSGNKKAKAEAVREFAEKVKETIYHYYDFEIDELVKEMEK